LRNSTGTRAHSGFNDLGDFDLDNRTLRRFALRNLEAIGGGDQSPDAGRFPKRRQLLLREWNP